MLRINLAMWRRVSIRVCEPVRDCQILGIKTCAVAFAACLGYLKAQVSDFFLKLVVLLHKPGVAHGDILDSCVKTFQSRY